MGVFMHGGVNKYGYIFPWGGVIVGSYPQVATYIEGVYIRVVYILVGIGIVYVYIGIYQYCIYTIAISLDI